MTAYWVVLAAVALTTLVAAVVGATLAAFAGQALPQAVRHELTTAGGTSISATAPVSGGAAAAQATATLKTAVGAALPGIPFAFWQASWSDPLGFAPGALRTRPASAPAGSTLLLTATAMQDIKARATLVAGHWPTAPGPAGAGQPIPAALPATAAALLHLSVGDVVRLSDRVSNAPVTFRITGLVARRQLPAATAYWLLDPVPASGSASVGGFTTFGPLLVDPAAFGAALPVSSATWAAQPDMAAFTDTDLGQVAADVSALQSSVASSAESSGAQLTGVQLTTGLAGVLSGTAENLTVARSLLAISAVQLLVLAVAALLAIARLLAAQRASETELLTARGATRWQLTRLTATEVIPLSCVAALVGAFAGIRLAQVLRRHPLPGRYGHRRHQRRRRGNLARRAGRHGRGGRHRGRGAALPGAAARPGRGRRRRAGRRPGPARQAGGARQRHPRGRGSRPDRARRAGRLAAAPLLGRLAGRRGRHAEHRPGARPRPRARAGRRHGGHAAPAARRGPRRGPAGRPRPQADRAPGQLAVQQAAAAPGRRRAAAGDGGSHRDARARPAPELDPVRRRPGGAGDRRRRAGRPARPAGARGGRHAHPGPGCAARDGRLRLAAGAARGGAGHRRHSGAADRPAPRRPVAAAREPAVRDHRARGPGRAAPS